MAADGMRKWDEELWTAGEVESMMDEEWWTAGERVGEGVVLSMCCIGASNWGGVVFC